MIKAGRRSSTGRTWAGVLALAGMLWLVETAPAVPPGGPVERANGATVSLDRTRVAQGGKVKVSGRNWKAKGSRLSGRAEVTVKLDDLHILAVLPIRDKRFSGWVRIPAQVGTGRHWLRFLADEPATSVKSPRFKVVRKPRR